MSASVIVCDPVGYGVGGVLGERHPHVFGLRAVDQVAENPAAPIETLPVAALAAVPAAATRGDARNQDPITHGKLLNDGADGSDRADGFVAEDAALGHLRHIAAEDVQIGATYRAASTRTTASVDSWMTASGTSSHARLPGP